MAKAHEVLGVAADADLHEIRLAYVERLKTTHPDAGGESGVEISELVLAYRSLRAAALRKRRTGISSTAVVPIAMRSRRGFVPPVPRTSRAAWWGRIATAFTLLIAIGAAAYVTSRLPEARRVNQPAVAPQAAKRPPADPLDDLDAVDEEVLRDAVAAVRSYTANEGVSGLETHSRRCFDVLAQAPNLRMLDYCLAFDSAASNSAGVAAAARATGEGAFFYPDTIAVRHQAALARLLPDKEAALARHSEVEARATSELMRAMKL